MKKFMKSTLLIATVAAIGIAAVACNGDDDQTEPKATQYAVTYSIGEGATGTAPTGGTYAEGATFTLAQATGFSKIDYSFDGWYDGVNTYDAGATYTMPAHAVTLTAKWIEDEEEDDGTAHTLTYVIGDDATGEAPTGGEYMYGDKITLATAFDFYKSGYVFGGWSDGKNVYPMGAEYVMTTSDTTLTAVWNDPLTTADVLGKWTAADGSTMEIIDNKLGVSGVDCSAIIDGSTVVSISFDESIAVSLDSARMWVIYGTPSSLIMTEMAVNEEDATDMDIVGSTVYNSKSDIVNSEMSEFEGKWVRTDTTQKWIIEENNIYYGTSLTTANAEVIGSKILLSYEAFSYTYIYILGKSDDKLEGYFIAPEKAPAEVTFEIGDYVVLTVNGTINQAVNTGAKPDADKIVAPAPEEGKEFSHWVLAGTETEFDINAVMNNDASITAVYKDKDVSAEKTYTGELVIGAAMFNRKLTSLTINTDTLEVTYVYNGSSSTTTCKQSSTLSGGYDIEIATFDYIIKIVDDTLEIYDEDGEDLLATFTLEQ